MKIIMTRHAKTEGNLRGAYVGRTDEPLCEEGIRLLKENINDQKETMITNAVDMVFVSPMKRCLETAELLYPGKEKIVIEHLRECDFGDFEMKTYKELDGNADYQAWIDSGGTLPFPNGESHEAFVERCLMGFSEVMRISLKNKVTCAAMVVHGGTIMAILDRWSDPHKDYFNWQMKNAESRLFNCCPDIYPSVGFALTEQKFV